MNRWHQPPLDDSLALMNTQEDVVWPRNVFDVGVDQQRHGGEDGNFWNDMINSITSSLGFTSQSEPRASQPEQHVHYEVPERKDVPLSFNSTKTSAFLFHCFSQEHTPLGDIKIASTASWASLKGNISQILKEPAAFSYVNSVTKETRTVRDDHTWRDCVMYIDSNNLLSSASSLSRVSKEIDVVLVPFSQLIGESARASFVRQQQELSDIDKLRAEIERAKQQQEQREQQQQQQHQRQQQLLQQQEQQQKERAEIERQREEIARAAQQEQQQEQAEIQRQRADFEKRQRDISLMQAQVQQQPPNHLQDAPPSLPAPTPTLQTPPPPLPPRAAAMKIPVQTTSGPSVLKLTVLYASHLPRKDTLGSCDAYVVVEVGGKQAAKTRRVMDSLHPSWDESFVLHGVQAGVSVTIKVYDYDQLSMDDFVGEVAFPAEGGTCTKTYPLTNQGHPVIGQDKQQASITVGFDYLPSGHASLGAPAASVPPQSKQPTVPTQNNPSPCATSPRALQTSPYPPYVPMNREDYASLYGLLDQLVEEGLIGQVQEQRVLQAITAGNGDTQLAYHMYKTHRDKAVLTDDLLKAAIAGYTLLKP